MKIAIGGGVLAALLLGLLWWTRSEEPSMKPSERESCHHSEEARPAPTPLEIERAKTEFRQSIPRIAGLAAEGKVEELNRLQERLSARLAEGSITAYDILERIRVENDVAVLDVLMGVLKENPPVANQPEVVQAFLRMAQETASEDRRQVALAFLGGAWDQNGDVGRLLLDLSRAEPSHRVRLSALAALEEYTIRNPAGAEAINGELLAIASAAPPLVRSASLRSINMVEAGEGTVRGMIGHTEDPAVEVRICAYERLGESKADFRGRVLSALEAAVERERDEVGMGQAVTALVKAGRAEALPALRRMAQRSSPIQEEVLAFIRVLESGETDWERIREH